LLFSEHFPIGRITSHDSWFDPILDHDTKLFIDPFLIFSNPRPPFEGAHAKIIRFFDAAFHLAAQTTGRGGVRYRKLRQMLLFPEASELCLGYTAASTSGSGSGYGFSQVIAEGIFESIAAGIVRVEHFEEIGLLHEGIGCDRISDITANILKGELAEYTRQVCARHRVATERQLLRNGRFDFGALRWENTDRLVPRNPMSGRPLLLVPYQFLRTLPTINPDDFWDYLWSNENERMRDDFGFEVKSKVRKHDIIRIARENRFLVQQYLEELEERGGKCYDLGSDPQGLYQWDRAAFLYVRSHPQRLPTPRSRNQFLSILRTIVEQFKHFVEEEGGWRLLWNDTGTPKPEGAAQLLFQGIVKHYCRANDVDVSREVETGRGPVDFKFSAGYRSRALLEVKLASNSRFWNGLTKQVPTYLDAAEVRDGFVLVVVHTEDQYKRLGNIQEAIRARNDSLSWTVTPLIVDATRKQSASKL
jgi:hypothetical protein